MNTITLFLQLNSYKGFTDCSEKDFANCINRTDEITYEMVGTYKTRIQNDRADANLGLLPFCDQKKYITFLDKNIFKTQIDISHIIYGKFIHYVLILFSGKAQICIGNSRNILQWQVAKTAGKSCFGAAHK